MQSRRLSAAILMPLLLLEACASQPMGPTVAVMPAPSKPFEVFQSDQGLCKQYASGEVQGGPEQANDRQVGTAIVGTLLGAGLGAALGGGRGAAIGAGAGVLGGTAAGASPSGKAQYGLQQRYDLAYSQCMYARGNMVPGFQSAVATSTPAYSAGSQPAPGYASYAQPAQGYTPYPQPLGNTPYLQPQGYVAYPQPQAYAPYR